MRGRRAAFLLAVAASTLGAVPGAAAHEGGSTGYAVLAVDRDAVRYTLTLWPDALPPAVAGRIAGARDGDAESMEQVLAWVRDKVALVADGRRCAAGAGFRPPAPAGTGALTVEVHFACGGDVERLRVRDDLFDVLGAGHHTLARINHAGRTVQFAFNPDIRETEVRRDTSGARGFASFVLLGIEHILTGWDHLLFLLVLLLRGGGWLSLAKIVTAFTLAHSVTLALAALDVVMLPDRLVEAVIALSIAAVAAENLFLRPLVARRWLVSFAFGLVHGFGFSAVLRALHLPTHGLVLSLLGFNTGVEVGQALMVGLALPALAVVRRTRWERRLVWSSSAAVLLVAVVLFLERALL